MPPSALKIYRLCYHHVAVLVSGMKFEGDVAQSTDLKRQGQALATAWLFVGVRGKNTVVGTQTYLTTTFFEIPRILTLMPRV
jgi:hypothetical protein